MNSSSFWLIERQEKWLTKESKSSDLFIWNVCSIEWSFDAWVFIWLYIIEICWFNLTKFKYMSPIFSVSLKLLCLIDWSNERSFHFYKMVQRTNTVNSRQRKRRVKTWRDRYKGFLAKMTQNYKECLKENSISKFIFFENESSIEGLFVCLIE